MGKGKNYRTRKIDSQKLKAEVIKRFGTVAKADNDLGFTHAIGNWVSRGEVPEHIVYLMESKWGLSYDDIKPDDMIAAEEYNRPTKPCRNCCEESNILLAVEDGKFSSTAYLLPRRKIIENVVAFGSELIMSENVFVNYCPFCGRKL